MLAACGGDDDSSSAPAEPEVVTQSTQASETQPSGEASPTDQAGGSSKLTKPTIQPPADFPTELIVRDLAEGSGPASKPGDELIVEYLAVDETGKESFSSWDNTTPFQLKVELGTGEFFPAFEKGLEGMKTAGRREIFFPAELTEKYGPLIYVIDVLELNRNERCWATQPLRDAEYSPSCTKSRVRVR